MEIFKTTLLPMSIYGFSTTVAGILFSTTVGSIVDTTPRLTGSSHPLDPFLFASKFVCAMGKGFFFSFYRTKLTPLLWHPDFSQECFNTCFLFPHYRPRTFSRGHFYFFFFSIAVQSFLFTQKLTTIIGALGFWILLTWFDPSTVASSPLQPSSATYTTTTAGDLTTRMLGLSMVQGYSLFGLMVVASGVLKLSALGWSISIERDWIVALCHSNSDALTRKRTYLTSIQSNTWYQTHHANSV